MVIEETIEARESNGFILRQDDLSRRLKYIALTVPAWSLLGGVAAMLVEPQFGLLASAVILGWTQIAGL